MKKNRIVLFVLSFVLVACSPKINQPKLEVHAHNEDQIKLYIPKKENLFQAVLWQQLSAEYKSLCYQSFNWAKIILNNALAKENHTKPLAIITDIDETILNNSPYSGKLIIEEENYSSTTWKEWGELETAEAIPGAKVFLQYAASKNVEVFYISNRSDIQKKETLYNLQKKGMPFCDADHLLLKTNTSAKQARRDKVLKNYEIVLLLGDNLSDFHEAFDDQKTARRNHLVDSLKVEFGNKFIVLPNPMYGDWETDGLYERKGDWNELQKDSIRRAKLNIY